MYIQTPQPGRETRTNNSVLNRLSNTNTLGWRHNQPLDFASHKSWLPGRRTSDRKSASELGAGAFYTKQRRRLLTLITVVFGLNVTRKLSLLFFSSSCSKFRGHGFQFPLIPDKNRIGAWYSKFSPVVIWVATAPFKNEIIFQNDLTFVVYYITEPFQYYVSSQPQVKQMNYGFAYDLALCTFIFP